MIKLEPHQVRSKAAVMHRMQMYGCCYLVGEMRCGKTLTALFAMHELKYKNVWFITTKKAIQSIEVDVKDAALPMKVTVKNYESFHKLTGKPDAVILDEAHELGAFPKPPKKVKMLKDKLKFIPTLLMSGTPTPESFCQLFHQFHPCMLGPWKNFENFYRFADHHVNKQVTYVKMGLPQVQYGEAKQSVIDAFNKYKVVMTQEQAGFKSKVTEHYHELPTPNIIKDLLKTLRKDGFASYAGYEIEADAMSKMSSAFHQLCSGTVIGHREDEQRSFTVSPFKADFIKENFAGKKIAIYYQYKEEFELLKRIFPAWTSDPATFKKEGSAVKFLSQMKAGAFGVNLATADALIFYNIPFSSVLYQQVRTRTQYKGREETPVHFLFSDTGFEKTIHDIVVNNKGRFTTDHFNDYMGTIYVPEKRSAIKEVKKGAAFSKPHGFKKTIQKANERDADTAKDKTMPSAVRVGSSKITRNGTARNARPNVPKGRQDNVRGGKKAGGKTKAQPGKSKRKAT